MSKLLAAALLAFVLTTGVYFGSTAARADEGQVDLLLVLAADVSRSVDDKEFKLQREGFAAAIVDPRVVRAMTVGPTGRIAVVFVEWASEFEQRVVVDWTRRCQRKATPRRWPRASGGRRAPSGGARRSARPSSSAWALLARSPFQAERKVIDISGDGTNNSGRDVTAARDAAIAQDVTINGLVILSDEPLPTNPTHTHPPGGLKAYYESNVIGGPGAFVLEAQNFEIVRPGAHQQAHQGDRRADRSRPPRRAAPAGVDPPGAGNRVVRATGCQTQRLAAGRRIWHLRRGMAFQAWIAARVPSLRRHGPAWAAKPSPRITRQLGSAFLFCAV